MLKKVLVVLFMASLVFTLASCGGNTVPGTENGVYSRYNIHYISAKGVNKGSYANWTDWPGHGFEPYNTKLQIKVSGWKKLIIVANSGKAIKTINWEIDLQNIGMSTSEYIKLITSPNPVSYEGLSEIDRQGIQEGKALPGMSKQGVMIALGYPAKHMTPSTDLNKWIYWKGRFNKLAVEFSTEGKVVSIK
jgi:hypothetical protein